MALAEKKVVLSDWQPVLDYLLPRVASLRTDQIAAAVGVDKRTVDRAFEGPTRDGAGKVVRPWLLGFSINAGGGERFTRRIPRDCAILWLAYCANYEPDTKLNLFCEVADTFCARDLAILHQRLGALLKKKL